MKQLLLKKFIKLKAKGKFLEETKDYVLEMNKKPTIHE